MKGDIPVLSLQDAERVVQRYRDRIAEHGPTLASLNSGDAAKQRARHQVHALALRGACPSVLDVGCGLGAFYEYLQEGGRACRYTGYDIVPEYIEICKTRFPRGEFAVRNVFFDGIQGVYDTIVMSQVLNNRYEQSSNVDVMEAALRSAFAAARISVSVDMLSTYVDFKRQEVFYYSPEAIFSFAKTLCKRVVLRHDYRPFEFSVQLFHEDAEGHVP